MTEANFPTDGLADPAYDSWRRERSAVAVPEGFADGVLQRCRERSAPPPSPVPSARSTLVTVLCAVAASGLFLLQGAALLSVVLGQ